MRKPKFQIVRVGPPPTGNQVLVLYDVVVDRTRNRVIKICQDFGLERIQYSAFLGRLNRNRRQELCRRLEVELEDEAARVRVQPINEDDAARVWILDQYRPFTEDEEAGQREDEEADPRLGS